MLSGLGLGIGPLSRRIALNLVVQPYAGGVDPAWTINPTSLVRNGGGGSAYLNLTENLVIGATYRVTMTVSGLTGDTSFFRLANVGDAHQIAADGAFTMDAVATGTSNSIWFGAWGGSQGTITLTEVSVVRI